MSAEKTDLEDLSEQLRTALESANLEDLSDLFDPDVRWGPPGDDASGCHNRQQALAWYRQGRDRGVHAAVTQVTLGADTILVGLAVSGGGTAPRGEANRWQVFRVHGGRIVEIRGFENHDDAQSFADG